MNKHTVFVDQDDLKSSPDVRSNAVASDHADAQQTFSGSRLGWAWLFVLVVFVAGLYLVQDMWRYAETLAEAKFNQRKGEVVNAIRYRMDNYEQALRGGLSLFAASDSVSREEWHSYINVLDVQNQFPGIQGIGYSLWLNPSDVAAHIGTIRGDGFPDYTVHPNHDRDEYTAIIYLEPFDERNRKAFGYDMWSQEVRHFAMSNARDTGETTISGRVTLVQEIDADVQAGFLMYLPHYGGLGAEPTVAERRDVLIGFVYSAFRMRDLMHGVVGDLEDIRVRIFDGTSNAPENQMFDSASAIDIGESAESPRFEASEILPIRGANWTLEFSSLPAFRKGDEAESQPLIVLIAVMVCGTLIGFVVWSWGGTQSRAGVMAETMLVSINRQKADLLILNQELEQFAYVASHDLRAPLRNINFIVTWIIEDHSGELSDGMTERLGDLRKCSERMDALLNSILEYSRLGSDEIQILKVETNKIVADAVSLICPPDGITVAVQENQLPADR